MMRLHRSPAPRPVPDRLRNRGAAGHCAAGFGCAGARRQRRSHGRAEPEGCLPDWLQWPVRSPDPPPEPGGGLFDRRYAVICRDSAAPVGTLWVIKGKGAEASPEAYVGAGAECRDTAAPASLPGLATLQRRDCRRAGSVLRTDLLIGVRGGRTYAAAGLGAYPARDGAAVHDPLGRAVEGERRGQHEPLGRPAPGRRGAGGAQIAATRARRTCLRSSVAARRGSGRAPASRRRARNATRGSPRPSGAGHRSAARW